jgi:hypothetical protein
MSILRFLFWVIVGLPIGAILAQTRLDFNTQVSPRPAMIIAEFAYCTASGPGRDCTGLTFVKLKYSNGAFQRFILTPTSDPEFVPDASWTRVPLTLSPAGASVVTAVPCAQTKP